MSSLQEFTRARQVDPCPTPSSTQPPKNTWMDNSFAALNSTFTPSNISHTTLKGNTTPGRVISFLTVAPPTPHSATLQECVNNGNRASALPTSTPTISNIIMTPKVLSFDSPLVSKANAGSPITGAKSTRTGAFGDREVSFLAEPRCRDVLNNGDSQSTVDRDADTEDSQGSDMTSVNQGQEASLGMVLECPDSPLLFATPLSTPPSHPEAVLGADVTPVQEGAAERALEPEVKMNRSSCDSGPARGHSEDNAVIKAHLTRNAEKRHSSGKFQATNGSNANAVRNDPAKLRYPPTRSLFKKSKAQQCSVITDSEVVTLDVSLSRNNLVEDTKENCVPIETTTQRDISSDLKQGVSETSTKIRTRSSLTSVKKESADDVTVGTRISRTNLRRACKKTSNRVARWPNEIASCVSRVEREGDRAQVVESCVVSSAHTLRF